MVRRYDTPPVPLPPTGRDPLGYDRPQSGPDAHRSSFDDTIPVTAPPSEPPQGIDTPARDIPHPDELLADHRGPRDAAPSDAGIVPAGSVTGRSLTLVISIMCFLASLTAGAVYMMNQSASAWLRDIASEVTVQVEPRDGDDMETRLIAIRSFLAEQRGIETASVLTEAASRELLEPWLGSASGLDDLPIPRLIAVQVDRDAPPDMDRIKSELRSRYPGADLDDHRQWQQQIRTMTRSFALGGLGILLLVGAATTAIIISATRSAMLSNRVIVEVLHFVGATDRFIAREFERHFLALGVRAGLVGASCAALVFIATPLVMSWLGGSGAGGAAEVRRLVGSGTLDGPGYLLIGIVVVVIAALCMLTSRFGVYRILHAQT